MIESKTIEFAGLIYQAVPNDTLNKWGASRYTRFKTQVWKHLEQSAEIESFVSNFFRFYPSDLSKIYLFLSENKNLQSDIYKHLSANLPLIIGRLQYENKINKKEDKKND